METIRQLLHDRQIFTIHPNDTVVAAAQHMVQHKVGALPVVDGGQLVGIFSERDIMNKVVAQRRDPAATKVSEIMTQNPTCVGPDDSSEHCLMLMKKHGFRHVPIWDGKELKGIISMRDLLLKEVEHKDGEVQAMRAYITNG